MERRNFIKTTATMAPLLSYFPASLGNIYREKTPDRLEKRSLGKTGEKLSIIGFGGIVVMDATPTEAANRVAEAIDYGVNYFDVAPSYGDAEIKLGPALESYRSKVFLACKTTERSKGESQKELDQSLKRLRTNYFDLYQLHSVTTLEEVDIIFGKNGAMETFLKAKKEGKIKHIGFSAHSVEAAMALMDRFDFDTILFPTNYATWYAGNFGPQVLAKAQEKEMGILALKAMARRPWPEGAERKYPKAWYEPLDEPDEAEMGLRFTLSHPVTAAIPPGDESLFKMALGLAARFKPLSSSEVKEIKEKGLKETPLFKYPQT